MLFMWCSQEDVSGGVSMPAGEAKGSESSDDTDDSDDSDDDGDDPVVAIALDGERSRVRMMGSQVHLWDHFLADAVVEDALPGRYDSDDDMESLVNATEALANGLLAEFDSKARALPATKLLQFRLDYMLAGVPEVTWCLAVALAAACIVLRVRCSPGMNLLCRMCCEKTTTCWRMHRPIGVCMMNAGT